MSKFPAPIVEFTEINRMIIEPIRSILLRTGLDLRIFDQLSEPSTPEDVSARIGTHLDKTVVLLDGLAACGLLEKTGGAFRNTALSENYLVTSSDTFLGPLVEIYQRSLIDPLENMTEIVRKGRSQAAATPSRESSESLDAYPMALRNAARGGPAQMATRIVGELPEFESMNSMLDIGGGPGIIAMAIVDSHPSMRGTILELPGMAEVARETILSYGMEERVDVISGDFLRVSVEEKYDLVWTSFCLYFGKQRLGEVVTKIEEALTPEGVFISLHEGLSHERTRPEILVLPQLAHDLMGRSFAFERGEIARALENGGFSDVESRMEDTPFGPVELVIARK
jgi:predicted O-methyltransferase YrrM